jgi:hypothetical protein
VQIHGGASFDCGAPVGPSGTSCGSADDGYEDGAAHRYELICCEDQYLSVEFIMPRQEVNRSAEMEAFVRAVELGGSRRPRARSHDAGRSRQAYGAIEEAAGRAADQSLDP